MLFLKLWLLVSIKPLWLRWLSVIASLAQIIILFKLLAKIFDKKTALITTFLISTSAYNIFWSIQVRSYPFFLLFQLIYLLIFIKAQEKNFLWWILLGLIGFINFSIEYGFFWLYISVNLFFLLNSIFIKKPHKNVFLGWIVSNILTLFLFLPYFLKFIEWSSRSPQYSILNVDKILGLHQPSLKTIVSLIYLYLTNSLIDTQNLFLLAYVIFFVINILYGSLNILRHRWGLFIIFISYVPLLLAVTTSLLISPVITDYQIMISSIGFFIIIGNLLSDKKQLVYLILPLFLVINLWQYGNYLKTGNYQGWQSALKYLSNTLDRNDFIAFYPNYFHQSYEYNYQLLNLPKFNQPKIIPVETPNDLIRAKSFYPQQKFCYLVTNLIEDRNINLLLKNDHYELRNFRTLKVYCLSGNL